MPEKEKLETIVISLGGSLIVPEEIDTDFLAAFRVLIEEFVVAGKRFMIVTGGGRTCRKYQQAAAHITTATKEELDWIGIYSVRLNAKLLQTICKNVAHPEIINHPEELAGIHASVIIGAAYAPGWSSDVDAVLFAEVLGAKRMVNLSNIDFAYEKDPKEYPDTKPIVTIAWKAYRELIPKEWDPGLHVPFDPIASRHAEELGIEVAIMNGKNLPNLRRYIEGEHFEGTTIHP